MGMLKCINSLKQYQKLKINNAFIFYNQNNTLLNNYVSNNIQELSHQNSLKIYQIKKKRTLVVAMVNDVIEHAFELTFRLKNCNDLRL
jgi:hypothetical protein